jgi:hypothetical protein
MVRQSMYVNVCFFSFDEAHFVDLFGSNASVFTKRQVSKSGGNSSSSDVSSEQLLTFSHRSKDHMFNALDVSQNNQIKKVN